MCFFILYRQMESCQERKGRQRGDWWGVKDSHVEACLIRSILISPSFRQNTELLRAQTLTLQVCYKTTDKHSINKKGSCINVQYFCFQSDVHTRLITVHQLSLIMNDSLIITGRINESYSKPVEHIKAVWWLTIWSSCHPLSSSVRLHL